ncbi:MAG: hypothetical protein N0E55_04405, partial [Candidatus Thiodiazotropha taylori]|nr:hypothetical protein [Candidatus Thiodiazotropha taylori]MCW4251933.1 hypothetical protein [Candidatus Thiodiazotropha taylori]
MRRVELVDTVAINTSEKLTVVALIVINGLISQILRYRSGVLSDWLSEVYAGRCDSLLVVCHELL